MKISNRMSYFTILLLFIIFREKMPADDDIINTLTAGTGPETSKVLGTALVVSWTAASSSLTPEENLKYKLVYSENDNISDEVGIENNGTVAMDWTSNTLMKIVTGLSTDTLYYFNVIVKDEAENVKAYSITNATTLFQEVECNTYKEEAACNYPYGICGLDGYCNCVAPYGGWDCMDIPPAE